MKPCTPAARLASLTLLMGCALSTFSTCALADSDYTDADAGNNTIGYYIGASVGSSNIDQSFVDQGEVLRRFGENRLGWKILMGVRPIPWLGAELEYLNFGDSSIGTVGNGGGGNELYGGHATATGGAGFAVGYLPLPLPWVDVFGKLGVARLQTRYSYTGYYPDNCGTGCTPGGQVAVLQNRTVTNVAFGGGAQVHLGPFAGRLEVERFSGLAGDPYLVSVGLTWAPF